MGNREDLLAGARRCLEEKGYARTTVRDIASAARVSMAAIGYHFGSREALLNQALFAAIDEWAAGSGRLTGQGATAEERYADTWDRKSRDFLDMRWLWLANIEAFVHAQSSPSCSPRWPRGSAGPGAWSPPNWPGCPRKRSRRRTYGPSVRCTSRCSAG